ncbi:MAG: diacylglycerol kinase family protein [Candidatus Doudnabacteria bacterium]
MKAALIINSRAKNANREIVAEVYYHLGKTDLEIAEFLEDDKRTIAEFAQDAVDGNFDIIIAAGGDGTISAIAEKLVGTKTKLGVIPIGTYNNFSKSLGIPLGIEDAVNNLINGIEQLIDVGEINGTFFINNSSIGFYTHLVIHRERQESKGTWRIFSTMLAVLKVFRSLPYHRVQLNVNGELKDFKTSLLFLGNGAYDYDGLDLGTRNIPNKGVLSVFALKDASRFDILKLSLKAFFRSIHKDSKFERHYTNEAIVHLPKPYIYVAKDGEIIKMKTPLHYKIKPKSLKVILPKEERKE